MQSYKVTDPKTGRSLKMTGNTPPSSQTIQKAFGSTGGTTAPRTTLPQAPQRGYGEQLASNILPSAGRLIGDTAGAIANVFNPDKEKNTLLNIGRLGAGVAQKLDPTEGNRIANPLINTVKGLTMPGLLLQDKGKVEDYEPLADNVGSFYKERYGGMENIKNTFRDDPVGVIADASALVTGGAGLVKGGATLANKGSLATKAGRVANVANKFDPVVLAGTGVGKVAKPVFSKLQGIPDEMVTKGIGNPKRMANAEAKAGRSVSSFIDEYDLYDRSPERASQVVREIGEKWDAAAMKSGKQMPVGQMVKAFDDEIANLEKGSGGVIADATASKIKELKRRKQMFLDSIVDSGSSPINVGLDQTTTFRRNVIDPDVPESQFGLNPKDKGKGAGAKAARDIFRKEGIKVSPELEKLGLDYGMAKELEKILKESAMRKNNRQMLNFTKLGTAGVGGVVSGIPGMVAGFAIEQIVNHPYFIKNASKGLRQALEAKLPQGVKTFSRNLYDTGRAGRMADDE